MKNFLKPKKTTPSQASDEGARITNETVAEHREKVLAGGRKFKYPIQYQKHRLVINSIVIGVVAAIVLVVAGWHQLYVAGNSSKMMYRLTQIFPVSVASVDGEPVRYSDYLMRYRSSLFYLQKQDLINLNSEDGKRQDDYTKRQELNNAEKNAFVSKLARENNISVSREEVDNFIKRDIDERAVSLNAYEKTVLNSYYDWSLDEYRTIVSGELLKRKTGFAIDNLAKDRADEVVELLSSGGDFAEIARTHSDDEVSKVNGGDVGVMPVGGLDPNGLIAEAKNLEKDQISELIQGVDSYYFIKLISKDDSNVHFRVIKISLKALNEQFDTLVKEGKIKEHITVRKDF